MCDVTGQVNDIWGTKTLASNFYDPTILRLCFFLFFEVEHETKKKVAKGKSLKQLQYNISLGGTCIIQVAISIQE
jgi:hypothetical protein